jgi:group I intron endonuclease
MQGIYNIHCAQEQRAYIGSSIDIHRRWSEHVRKLNNQTHHCKELQLAWDAYGDGSFEFNVLEKTNDLVQREQHWLNIYSNCCYNSSLVASNPMANPEVVKKQQASLKLSGKHYSPFKKNNPNKPIDEHKVKEIVSLLPTTNVKDIAQRCEVSAGTVYTIANGAKYSEISGIKYSPKNLSKRLSIELVLEIVELRKTHSVKDIAEITGIPERTIYNILNGEYHSDITGIKKTQFKTRKLTAEDVVEIKQTMRDTDATNKTIAEHYGCSSSTISSIRLGNRWGSVEVEGFTPGRRTKSTDVIESIKMLKSQGLSHKQIAQQLNLKSTSSVDYALSLS